MSRFITFLILLLSLSLTGCILPRGSSGGGGSTRGGGGGGDDDDDDDAASDDDDAVSDDDDDGFNTTHLGDAAGTIWLDDLDWPCQGEVELELKSEGMTDGRVDCEASNGWRCSASWTDGYAFSEAEPDEVSFTCSSGDDGGTAEGSLFLWGDSEYIGGSMNVASGVFDSVSVSFNAEPW